MTKPAIAIRQIDKQKCVSNAAKKLAASLYSEATPLSTFWSTSHKPGWIAAVKSAKPVGIDIEVMRPRDEALFSSFTRGEWNILGEKTWENFYRGWTAKEALLKKLNLELSDMNTLQIVSANKQQCTIAYYGIRHSIAYSYTHSIICAYTV